MALFPLPNPLRGVANDDVSLDALRRPGSVVTVGALRYFPDYAASAEAWARAAIRSGSNRLRRTAAGVLAICALAGAPSIVVAQTGSGIASGTYDYSVEHPMFGRIGTFRQDIRRENGDVIVDTNLRIDVQLFSVIPVYHLEADREEIWRDGRLFSYRSRTLANGTEVTVRGYARGDRFVVLGPDGMIEAPPTIHPTTPWSIAIIKARVVMAAESGRLVQISTADGGEEAVSVGGRVVRAHHYRIVGDGEHQLWFDRNDVPVKFAVAAHGAVVDFTLK